MVKQPKRETGGPAPLPDKWFFVYVHDVPTGSLKMLRIRNVPGALLWGTAEVVLADGTKALLRTR